MSAPGPDGGAGPVPGAGRPSRNDLGRYYFVLRAVSEIVAASHPLDETLTLVLKVVAEATAADRGLALVLDRKSSALTPLAEHRFRDALRLSLSIPIGFGPLGQAATGAVVKSPVAGDSPSAAVELAPGLAANLRAFVCQPMRTSEEVLGVLLLAKARRSAPFTEAAEDLIRACSDLAGIAVKRSDLLRDSQLDETTGAFNFRALIGNLEDELARAGRDSRPFSVLFLELDDFGRLNDRFGHLVGNMALKLLAETLKSSTRKRSGVRAPDIVARLGGDEFVVILPATDKETARLVAERIRAKTEMLQFPTGAAATVSTPLTVSIGVATYPCDGGTIKELLDRSDRAMYEAKTRGKNQVFLFSSDLLGKAVDYQKSRTDTVDRMTGLQHESSFRPALARGIRAAATYGQPLSLAILDLDDFKKLNDEAGHAAGDAVLRGVADALRSLTGEKGQVYRLTGDSFALILPAVGKEEAVALVDAIRREIGAKVWQPRGRRALQVAMTAGVASLPKDTVSSEELVMKAELALHHGKQRGGNCTEV